MKLTTKHKKTLARIIVSVVLLLIACFLPVSGWIRLCVFLVPYLLIGWDVLFHAVRNILRGQVFDENFLMALATVGAFFLGEYPEGVAVMIFSQVGELFESVAVNRSRDSIRALLSIRPETATVKRDGNLLTVSPDEVQIGETIVVAPGERIPLDGTVLTGESFADTSALTGESVPRVLSPGDTALSGCINQTAVIEIEVTKPFTESTVSKILELVEKAASRKAKTETFITRFAKWYTPCVVIGAAVLAILPPLILQTGFAEWIQRALIFLVISCPCALVISVPLGFFGGIGAASKRGILIKGSNYLEALSHAQTVVFDKTGTLTKGRFSVSGVFAADGFTDEQLLYYTAAAESFSSHPIAQSLKAACTDAQNASVEQASEQAGHGVCAIVDGHTVIAGTERFLASQTISVSPVSEPGTIVYTAVDGRFAGAVLIRDEVKPQAAQAVAQLHGVGISKTAMLTGDSAVIGKQIAAEVGIDDVHAELLPDAKVSALETIASSTENGTLVYTGDGINDAPVLARADVGVAMGGLGSDAAIEAADVVIMDDDPTKLTDAIRIAKRTMRIVKQNIVFALGVKFAVLILGIFGIATMWEAVFADVGVSVIAILNAMRALRYQSSSEKSK